MATNPAVSSKAGLIELLGRECYNDYFNEAVGRDSTMGLGDILLTSSRTHAQWSLLWTSYSWNMGTTQKQAF